MKKVFFIILVLCLVVIGGITTPSCTSYTSNTSILVDSVALSGLKYNNSKNLDIKYPDK